MTYGILKCDTVTFTDAGVDKSVTLSGLVQNPTFSGNVTVTGTLSGVTVTGTTANFTSGNFTNISGGTHTITSGVFAAGSAASPSITFTGDLNTGIYSPGADQVAISTGGSPRVTVTSTGVGIGTTSPSQLLHVASALTTGGATPVTWSRSGGATGYLLVDGSGAGIYSGGAFNDSGIYLVPNDRVSFSVNGSERFRCDSSGRLLVGTSSTSATLTALIQGNSSSATSSAGLLLARGEAPGADGTVLGALDYSANNHVLAARILCKRDGGTWTAGTSQPTRLEFSTTADGASSPTERMRISSNGQISSTLNGTTNAANLTLNVGGVGDPGNNAWITPRIDFTGSALASPGTTFIGATGGLGGRSLVFATGSDAAGSERMRIDSAGHLGLGATPSAWSGVSARGFNIGARAVLFNISSGSLFGDNWYFNGTNDIRIEAGYASRIFCNDTGQITTQTTGTSTAGSTITWTQGPYIANGGTSWTNSSDERLKTITGEISDALNKVSQLRAAEFYWNADKNKTQQVGLIAQDLLEVLPQVVVVPETKEKEDDSYGKQSYLGVNYDQVIPLLVAALKESGERIETLEAKVAALESA